MLQHEPELHVTNVIALIGAYLVDQGILSDDPTHNTGVSYENEVFLISAYDWHEEDGSEVTPNFWWKVDNYQVEWYKYLGRGTYANRDLNPSESLMILWDCIDSIDKDYSSPRVNAPEFVWEDVEPDDDE